MPRPATPTLYNAIAPRLKELQAAGCRVFIEFDRLPHEVMVDEDGKVYATAKWLGEHRTYMTRHFFDTIFSPGIGMHRGRGATKDFTPNYTIEQVMELFGVDINLANYKEKITALTAQS